MTTTEQDDRIFRLADGRVLGYREFGDPAGFPMFLFHGIPGSRCGTSLISDDAGAAGMRVIGVDRPGIGLSTFQPGRRFLDWPGDLRQLADSLGFDQFGVVGNSGGSAYVAACALLMPERLSFAGIISGMGPLDIPRWKDELRLARSRRFLVAVSRFSPNFACRLAAPILGHEFDPKRPDALERMKRMMAPADGVLLDQPRVARAVLRDAEEALKQGPLGVSWDLLLYALPWGFRLEDVRSMIYLWHGEADITVPPMFGREIARELPRCRATFWPDEGHLMAVSRARQIIDAIKQSLKSSAPLSVPT